MGGFIDGVAGTSAGAGAAGWEGFPKSDAGDAELGAAEGAGVGWLNNEKDVLAVVAGCDAGGVWV